MADSIPQHTHCMICGKAIPFDQKTCSDDCKVKYENYMKKRKMISYALYALIIITAIVILVFSYI